MTKDSEIYLIGSYHGFRDKLIEALPEFTFADPRKHRQSSTAKLVCDDLGAAEESPIALAVFPKGKSRGVMSYVEIGAALEYGNHLIVVDENEEPDSILIELSQTYFGSIDSAVEYLRSSSDIKVTKKEVQSNYPAGSNEVIPMNRICICGKITKEIQEVFDQARRMRTEKQFVLGIDTLKEFKRISSYDLLVANFPADSEEYWDREACLMMGGAYAHDISILIIDDYEWKYPPLQAVAKRHSTTGNLLKYLTEVDDLNVAVEARNMYNFFERERLRRQG